MLPRIAKHMRLDKQDMWADFVSHANARNLSALLSRIAHKHIQMRRQEKWRIVWLIAIESVVLRTDATMRGASMMGGAACVARVPWRVCAGRKRLERRNRTATRGEVIPGSVR